MAPKRKYPGVTSYRDRHGRTRWRVRKDGRQAELGTVFGSEDFEARYAAFINEEPSPVEIRHPPGTFGALVVAFRSSRDFQSLSAGTRNNYLRFFDLLKRLEDQPCGDRFFQTKHAQFFIETIPTDAARSNARKKLGALMRFAMRSGVRNTDPVAATVSGYSAGDGIAPWTREQVEAAMARYPLSTSTGLALRLMYETGAALADVVRLGPDNIIDGCAVYDRQKTGKRTPATAVCPLSEELLVRLAETTADTFIQHNGKKRSAAGLGNRIRAVAAECGFKGSAHGIRKARANALISAGADIEGVAAVLGHTEIKTTAHYTRAAARMDIAKKAVSKTNPETSTD